MNDLTPLILQFSTQFTLNEQDVLDKLSNAKGWDSKYREIMLLGKNLSQFVPELKLDSAKVSGCESTVWLHHAWQEDKLRLAMSSDSKIVRGLLAIVLAKLNGTTSAQLSSINLEPYFTELGLEQHLSPSRSNGLKAIVEAIKVL